MRATCIGPAHPSAAAGHEVVANIEDKLNWLSHEVREMALVARGYYGDKADGVTTMEDAEDRRCSGFTTWQAIPHLS